MHPGCKPCIRAAQRKQSHGEGDMPCLSELRAVGSGQPGGLTPWSQLQVHHRTCEDIACSRHCLCPTPVSKEQPQTETAATPQLLVLQSEREHQIASATKQEAELFSPLLVLLDLNRPQLGHLPTHTKSNNYPPISPWLVIGPVLAPC